jgi:hypothetical protein
MSPNQSGAFPREKNRVLFEKQTHLAVLMIPRNRAFAGTLFFPNGGARLRVLVLFRLRFASCVGVAFSSGPANTPCDGVIGHTPFRSHGFAEGTARRFAAKSHLPKRAWKKQRRGPHPPSPRAYASPCVTKRPVRSVAVCECPDPSDTTSCVRSPRRQHDSEITVV